MSGVKLRVAREGVDVFTGDAKDMALDSDYFLPKIYRNKRSTSTTGVAHGLGYTPSVIFFREITSSPKVYGYTAEADLSVTQPSVDDTNVNFQLMTHKSDFSTSPYTTATDSASVALMMIDPLGTPSPTPDPNDFNGPVVLVGGTESGPDYNRDIHSKYDTLKVYSSGTITLNVSSWTPSAGDEYDVTSATYTHNLGYIPMFAPNIPYQTSLPVYYTWYWQWHNRHSWSTSTEYLVDDYVQNPAGTFYICTKYHISSSSTEPGVGANWTSYWTLNSGGAPAFPPTTIDLNDYEQIKYVFGGAFVIDDEQLEVYVTTTQLVVKLHRISGGMGYNTFPARTITLSYTVFYNRLDEEFNILA